MEELRSLPSAPMSLCRTARDPVGRSEAPRLLLRSLGLGGPRVSPGVVLGPGWPQSIPLPAGQCCRAGRCPRHATVGRDRASPRVGLGLSWLRTWGSLERGAHRRCVQEEQTLGFRLSWALAPVLSGPTQVGCSSDQGGSGAPGNLQSPGRPSPGLRAAVARGPSRWHSLGWLQRCRQQRGRAMAVPTAPWQRSTSIAVSYHITLYFIAHCVTGII